MKDYELGRLAEELIEKRYADKIKGYEDKLKSNEKEMNKLGSEVNKLKNEKVYLRYSSYSGLRLNSYYDPYEYISIDEITEDLKNTKEELKNTERKHSRMIHDFNNLPWYKKLFVKLED